MPKSSTAHFIALAVLIVSIAAIVSAITLLPAAAQEDTTYVIQYGDTLSQIAMEFDAQIECIADANDILVNLILFPDMELTIPGDCPPYGAPVVIPPGIQPAPGDWTVVMQPREVVLLIAEELNVSAEAILVYNRIVNAFSLRAGTTLVIWEDAPPFGIVPPLRIYNPDT
ncbi:MAG: LysM peptidoglycan-binding domain-containing protein, partial [Burkholderiales bacterium]|nr:LysM peptidoglycan-binding domain-containing protein [Anaerolineae bacterium]